MGYHFSGDPLLILIVEIRAFYVCTLCGLIKKYTTYHRYIYYVTRIFIASHNYLSVTPMEFYTTSLHITSPLPESTYLYIYIPTYLPSTCPILDPTFYIFNDCICLHAYQYWSANSLTNLFCIAQVCQYWKSYSLIHIYL